MLRKANKLGINTPWLRPKKFSLDKSSSFEATLHAIQWFENKFFKIDAIALFQIQVLLDQKNILLML